jgi:hypothetical protein
VWLPRCLRLQLLCHAREGRGAFLADDSTTEASTFDDKTPMHRETKSFQMI